MRKLFAIVAIIWSTAGHAETFDFNFVNWFKPMSWAEKKAYVASLGPRVTLTKSKGDCRPGEECWTAENVYGEDNDTFLILLTQVGDFGDHMNEYWWCVGRWSGRTKVCFNDRHNSLYSYDLSSDNQT
jgi:hypothetical protein